jgi:hypothetical protein
MARRDLEKHGGTLKRRDLLKAISAIPAAALIKLPRIAASQKKLPAAPARALQAYRPKVLNDHEWKAIRLLSDLIIPRDDRSGSATEAGVPEFIDDWLDFKGDALQAEIRGGLTWLDLECQRLFKSDFAESTEAQQKQILDRIAFPQKAAPEDSNAVAFFNELRNLVVSGFFSSKMGVHDLPYLGNTMVAEWKGCPEEVLEKIRQNIKSQRVPLTLESKEVESKT